MARSSLQRVHQLAHPLFVCVQGGAVEAEREPMLLLLLFADSHAEVLDLLQRVFGDVL